MGRIWRLCFATLVFAGVQMVNAREKTAQEITIMRKFHTDLTNFVTEPDIKAPVFDITHYNEETISPGYWFIDPYDNLIRGHMSSKAQLFQVGAHMYDNRGELVWSGASFFENRLTFDFKAVQINGTTHLSLILDPVDVDRKGAGIIMDSHYRIKQKVRIRDSPGFNMHEFNIIENGRSALGITWLSVLDSVGPSATAWIGNNGFQEIDLRTNKVLFDWQSLDYIDVSTSKLPVGGESIERSWDWIHINSIDKNADGDYMVSARHTSTIYKVSSRDGSIIWQLGGDNSSFVHEGGFNFSWQHDARFRKENNTHTIISFLNNASNGDKSLATANTSSVLYVALRTDTFPMTATVITQFDRPDGNQTYLRGNVQQLPNDNTFVGWSENGYISEFTPSGELALEATFASKRLVAYRARKYNFTGLPLYPPAVKTYAFGTTAETITTVFYVSWNGATEVTEWRFYGNGIQESQFELVGQAKKESFETMFMSTGYHTLVYVEGFNAKGESLGRSEAVETIVPPGWEFAGCLEGSCQIPDIATPLIGYAPDEEEHTEQVSQYGNNEEGDAKQDGQNENVSTSKDTDEFHSVRNAVRILLVSGGLVLISLLFVLQRRRRSRQSALTKKYEPVRSDDSDDSSLDGV